MSTSRPSNSTADDGAVVDVNIVSGNIQIAVRDSSAANIDITALKTEGPKLALLRSKAIGEPPFMYGIGAYFALAKAIREFNSNYKIDFDAPLTPEKVLMRLYQK